MQWSTFSTQNLSSWGSVHFAAFAAIVRFIGLLGIGWARSAPEPAAPPLLIITMVPTIETPDGLISMKFPPTFRSTPAGLQHHGHSRFQVDDLTGLVGKIGAYFSYRFSPAWREKVWFDLGQVTPCDLARCRSPPTFSI